ncbi:ATP synthase F1 subunit delta [Lactobacillus acetotolerans]|jgi:F-type H+-transporting ATPase subunit delta|uniref:ATP synthase subunit delta n=1 Tax=Lactobacillus acetotolerans TaxID=1600 RepID=A0A0D6A3P4_9LACO|nr:ATP synthase F1 subunit delta [Lactobacillus acetotolerans]KRN40008.1 ATP synthase F1 sector delta subunit [Lactobacillus acetotolerans DSM 20749 = JCM 3825]QFG51457.1 F0F1 ATP synthase subunit delta [Lactobacillus acetotolerans]QGV04432.1 F0F1 ATP synthase subunit delta [Lactobacillus acetotolerans]QJD73347.1 F0F1 ATP synthase subunit delta [Lactobacillus acetotolerans]BAQ57447.1 F0F1 ATP synthase subunit delta [Lactobacillus acetotolerans]
MALSREEIANRYGSALFGYAQDMRALETVYDDLQELKKAVQANPRILTILSDPILNGDEKKKSLSVIEQGFSKEVQAFLNLLLEYNRFGNLLDIINRFNDLYDDAKSITSGTAITAVKLDPDQLKHLSESYAKKYNLNAVRLKNQVDPSILGGVILQVKDRVIDGSVKNKLTKIRAQLINND